MDFMKCGMSVKYLNMKKLFTNKPSVKQYILITTAVALSILARNNLISLQHEKLSVPITPSTTISTNLSQKIQPQVYLLRSVRVACVERNRDKLTLVAKSLPSNISNSSSSQQRLTIVMQQLLVAQPRDDLTSTIPKGTKLLSLQIRADGVYVDLSPEFRSGGGSTSMIYRVAQVIYTVSSIDPDREVFISVGGQSIDNNHPLGGEGLTLRQPITRSQFAADFL
jgi:spore germination protein GerM